MAQSMDFKNTSEAIKSIGSREFIQMFKKKFPNYKQTRHEIRSGLRINSHQVNEVLEHVKKGLSNERIGEKLGCSEMTVIRFRKKHDIYLRN